MLIFPDAKVRKHREILFLKETNAHIAVWEGAKLDKKQAYQTSGIQTVYWLDEFEAVLKDLVHEAKHVYLNTNEHLRAKIEVETRDARLKMDPRNLSDQNYELSAPIMHKIRAVKDDVEIALIQKACDLTESAFRKILKTIKPGVME